MKKIAYTTGQLCKIGKDFDYDQLYIFLFTQSIKKNNGCSICDPVDVACGLMSIVLMYFLVIELTSALARTSNYTINLFRRIDFQQITAVSDPRYSTTNTMCIL